MNHRPIASTPPAFFASASRRAVAFAVFVLALALLIIVGALPVHAAGSTERVSVDSGEGQAIGGDSSSPSVSADGRFVAFYSAASNLVAGDTNGLLDVFVRDRALGTTERVNVDSVEAQVTGGDSFFPSISADGRFVAFQSSATNLVAGDTNASYDIFVRDRTLGSTERVSVDSAEAQATGGHSQFPSISADGDFVAFHSAASNLVAGDTNGITDIFVRDRALGITERVSVDSNEAQATGSLSQFPSISAAGRFVAFHSGATNLVAGDTNGFPDVFVRDRTLGTTNRVSLDSAEAQATGGASFFSAISADGRFAAFISSATNLVAGDTNAIYDVFVRDNTLGTTERVSVDSTEAQATGGDSNIPAISADGRFVAFSSLATNLVVDDTNALNDVFVRDRALGSTARVNADSSGTQATGGDSSDPDVGADGRFVAFHSFATNLVTGDGNFYSDVFVTFADDDGDGVPNSNDNCPAVSNSDQANSDVDSLGNACDPDDDNDTSPDVNDGCPTLPEDFDGYQDADGCPDTDDDGDNIPDTSDTGKMCFDPAGTLTCGTISCRLAAEDYDAFKDTDGCPEPDNDNDGFTDATDDCPGTDSRAGADGMLGSPQDLNHNGVQNGAEAALTTDDVMPALVWEDSDGVLDYDGCHDSPGDDFDGDGFTDDEEVFTHLTDAGNPDTDADTVIDGTDNCPNWSNASQAVPTWTIPALDSDCDGFTVAREQYMGTDPTRHCPNTVTPNDEPVDAWPSDFNDSRLTSLADVVLMGPVYNQATGTDPAKKRFDLNASGIVSLADVVLMGPFYNKSCG